MFSLGILGDLKLVVVLVYYNGKVVNGSRELEVAPEDREWS